MTGICSVQNGTHNRFLFAGIILSRRIVYHGGCLPHQPTYKLSLGRNQTREVGLLKVPLGNNPKDVLGSKVVGNVRGGNARKLAQKEIDLREKEVLTQNEEIHRKLAQKEIDLREKEILAQKEVRRKPAQKEIDLRHKEILTQKEVRRKLAQKELHLQDKEILAQE